jgi:hypothetical protein
MPHSSKKASQAKTQRLVGNSSFSEIIRDDPGSEWEDDNDESTASHHHQVWQYLPAAEALIFSPS